MCESPPMNDHKICSRRNSNCILNPFSIRIRKKNDSQQVYVCIFQDISYGWKSQESFKRRDEMALAFYFF